MVRVSTWIAAAMLFLTLAPPSTADYAAGRRAWDDGRHGEALVQWRSAAGAGDPRAMLALGRLHVQGLGAPQDYVEAHKWFNLAASRGVAEGLKERDALSARMTPRQIALAQERASSWRANEELAGLQAAANAGDRRAMLALGRHLARDRDGPEHRKEAHMWLNLAASRGEVAALEVRDGLAEHMTPAELAAAQAMAREWRPQDARSEGATRAGSGATAGPVSKPGSDRAASESPRSPNGSTATPARREGRPAAEAVREAQVLLRALGYRPGPADGVWGARTAEAYRAFVNDAGIAAAEALTPNALQAMRRITARRGALAPAGDRNDVVSTVRRAGAGPEVDGQEGEAETAATSASEAPVRSTIPARPAEGERLRDCADCPEMVVVPGGTYMMGSPPHEAGRWEDEGPRHAVTIDGPFAVGRYEVTFAQWNACRRAGGCSHAPGDAGWGRGDRPAINVSWKDAQEYVAWLSETTGKTYRLLSESEWEYAARGGTDAAYFWGSEPEPGRANCARCGGEWAGKKTAPAGSFAPNGFGLFDMLGNVWEWVEDCGHASYDGAPADGSAWLRAGDCRFRMLRGGSWDDAASRVRSAIRYWELAETRGDMIGFRVAATLE